MVGNLAAWRLRALVWLVPGIVAAAVVAVPTHAGAAASRLYNMDRFLNEPHPFATPHTPAPYPVVSPPAAAPPPTAQAVPAAPADEDDLEMGQEDVDFNDPLETVNRGIFAFNEFFLEWVLGPISGSYNRFVPDPVRTAVGNLLDNVASPTILANDLLQGELKRAWETTQRVVINSTVGLAGMIDVAEHLGIPKHKEDLGQTLAVWGVGEGFYLVLPFFGPSNPRDAIGRGIDGYVHPLFRWASNTNRDEINYGIGGATAVHEYAVVKDDLDKVRETSVDFYAALRSIYRQRRKVDIVNGQPVGIRDLEYELP